MSNHTPEPWILSNNDDFYAKGPHISGSDKTAKVEPTCENGNSTKLPVSCLICPSCGNSDKYVKYYDEDMICHGCGYDLRQINS